ncbi:SDR family NAD(P)-dependent oxidoreductase [Curtobacterium sp. ISL-83]|uniref:SDR family NAD(P)-dependent oxidoreductase n=1 Tax=Curtobacterium sp. ISL-83 TaxID=2819145 RepID=UPI001BE74B3A|nr:SDR family NAD(P)-dependent oxidoreductase [Curtobacterium sp. ISL-83]MBT2501716.1 SDR family NAD(P)-dependent oxidoreductase [Curtobacterium sp. ISL-83]
MSRILVTGSADGLGRAAAETLIDAGHDVLIHARTTSRLDTLGDLRNRAAGAVVADFSDADAIVGAAEELNRDAPLDAVIHNAGVVDGAPLMVVNVVAPYLLTALLPDVSRHVYISSGMHRGGSPAALDAVDWSGTRSSGSYSDSKLFVTALSLAVARLRPESSVNAVDPGWVPTKMGGPGASDDLEAGHRTQEWLATSDDPEARTTGGYWFHRQRQQPHKAAMDVAFQNRVLDALQAATGVHFDQR